MLTKSKFTGAALATLALAGCLVATSGNAQAHPRFGVGLGIGIATGAVIGAPRAAMPPLMAPVSLTVPSGLVAAVLTRV